MGHDRRGNGTADDARQRSRLRGIAFVVIVLLLVVAVVAPLVGQFIGIPVDRPSDILVGTLVGALLLLVGVEGAARFLPGGDK